LTTAISHPLKDSTFVIPPFRQFLQNLVGNGGITKVLS